MICELFPEKNPGLNGYSSLIFLNFCKNSSKCENRLFSTSVVFVVFVAFLGTMVLFFKKSNIRAFRKVYGLWGYLQPLKSYGRFKFPNTTVTHLCFKAWYEVQKWRWFFWERHPAPIFFLLAPPSVLIEIWTNPLRSSPPNMFEDPSKLYGHTTPRYRWEVVESWKNHKKSTKVRLFQVNICASKSAFLMVAQGKIDSGIEKEHFFKIILILKNFP